jgi:ribosomal protein S18 acetylase RimI-like enzyme
MGWPEGVTTGPLRAEHGPAAIEVANAIATADDSGAYVVLDDFVRSLIGADSLGLWLDGRLAGYGLVFPRDIVDGQSVVTVKGGIDPAFRRRGLGGPLLDWQVRSAAEHAELVDVGVEAGNAGGLALVGSRGFRPVRYYRVMQRWYDDRPVQVPSPPDGFAMIAFEPSYDERLRLAYNEIFVGQWGVLPHDEDHWRTWFTGHRALRPALSRLVVDGDRIAAFAMAYEFTVDTEHTGVRELWIGQVGARAEYRGRGLARAAMSAVLRAGQTAGFARSSLGVDAENPTSASRLYESLGFVIVTSQIQHRLSLVRRSAET